MPLPFPLSGSQSCVCCWMGCIQDPSTHPFRPHGVFQCWEWLLSRNGHAELEIAVKPLILQVWCIVGRQNITCTGAATHQEPKDTTD